MKASFQIYHCFVMKTNILARDTNFFFNNRCLVTNHITMATVGVPGGSVRGDRDGRPLVGSKVHPAPYLRGFRGAGHIRPETHEGGLEWGGLPCQLLHC